VIAARRKALRGERMERHLLEMSILAIVQRERMAEVGFEFLFCKLGPSVRERADSVNITYPPPSNSPSEDDHGGPPEL
jgi:hypothetical protein